jgi:hypothetical protein
MEYVDLSSSHALGFVVWNLLSVNMITMGMIMCEARVPSRKHELWSLLNKITQIGSQAEVRHSNSANWNTHGTQ